MSRYSGSNGGSNDNDYDDNKTLKLQKFAAVRLTPTQVTGNRHKKYGASFIPNFEDAEVIDGIVFQREDADNTWKIFSAGKFFNLNPEDGLVYESLTEEDGYEGQMSAQDILDHPRVVGFSENFGGEDYYYTPVGVVVEEAGQIAVNDDLEIETTDEPAIEIGDSSMLLGNKSWTRTLAKKMAAQGDSVVADNGESGEDNPKYDNDEWLTTDDPDLRDDLEGRSLELWITEETRKFDDGEEVTFTVPNLLDVKTGNHVSIDNGLDGDDSDSSADAESEQAAATDGGTVTESGGSSSGGPSLEETDGLPEGVPDSLTDLLDYMARKRDDNTADQIRAFAEDEVEDPDEINWEAAAEEANRRAESAL